jgi:hypothetical protein
MLNEMKVTVLNVSDPNRKFMLGEDVVQEIDIDFIKKQVVIKGIYPCTLSMPEIISMRYEHNTNQLIFVVTGTGYDMAMRV